MPLRTWPILAFAFAALLIVFVVSAIATSARAMRLQQQIRAAGDRYQLIDRDLQSLRASIYISSLMLRDYLLGIEKREDTAYRARIESHRRSAMERLSSLNEALAGRYDQRLESLSTELTAYWQSVSEVFAWTAEERRARALIHLGQQTTPRREKVIAIAEEVADLNAAALRETRSTVARLFQDFGLWLQFFSIAVTATGVVLAAVSVWHVARLEKRSAAKQTALESAERDMRKLSQQLVKAQETERHALSRELHDQIGQILTAVRIGVGELAQSFGRDRDQFQAVAAECASAVEETIATVRDLAARLRPAMLDDIGLSAAIRWQAREFSRRYDTPVAVNVPDFVDTLGEPQRTSIYRIIQEALTNCARHAHANSVEIRIEKLDAELAILIKDNGVGAAAGADCSKGLGLLGMRERARDLGGSLALDSVPGKGTAIMIRIPSDGTR